MFDCLRRFRNVCKRFSNVSICYDVSICFRWFVTKNQSKFRQVLGTIKKCWTSWDFLFWGKSENWEMFRDSLGKLQKLCLFGYVGCFGMFCKFGKFVKNRYCLCVCEFLW